MYGVFYIFYIKEKNKNCFKKHCIIIFKADLDTIHNYSYQRNPKKCRIFFISVYLFASVCMCMYKCV